MAEGLTDTNGIDGVRRVVNITAFFFQHPVQRTTLGIAGVLLSTDMTATPAERAVRHMAKRLKCIGPAFLGREEIEGMHFVRVMGRMTSDMGSDLWKGVAGVICDIWVRTKVYRYLCSVVTALPQFNDQEDSSRAYKCTREILAEYYCDQKRKMERKEVLQLASILSKTAISFFYDEFHTGRSCKEVTLNIASAKRRQKPKSLQSSPGGHQALQAMQPYLRYLLFIMNRWSYNIRSVDFKQLRQTFLIVAELLCGSARMVVELTTPGKDTHDLPRLHATARKEEERPIPVPHASSLDELEGDREGNGGTSPAAYATMRKQLDEQLETRDDSSSNRTAAIDGPMQVDGVLNVFLQRHQDASGESVHTLLLAPVWLMKNSREKRDALRLPVTRSSEQLSLCTTTSSYQYGAQDLSDCEKAQSCLLSVYITARMVPRLPSTAPFCSWLRDLHGIPSDGRSGVLSEQDPRWLASFNPQRRFSPHASTAEGGVKLLKNDWCHDLPLSAQKRIERGDGIPMENLLVLWLGGGLGNHRGVFNTVCVRYDVNLHGNCKAQGCVLPLPQSSSVGELHPNASETNGVRLDLRNDLCGIVDANDMLSKTCLVKYKKRSISTLSGRTEGHWAGCTSLESRELYSHFTSFNHLRVCAQDALMVGPREQCSGAYTARTLGTGKRALSTQELHTALKWLLSQVPFFTGAPPKVLPTPKVLQGKLALSDPCPPSLSLVYASACLAVCLTSGIAKRSAIGANAQRCGELKTLHSFFAARVWSDGAAGCCSSRRCAFATASPADNMTSKPPGSAARAVATRGQASHK